MKFPIQGKDEPLHGEAILPPDVAAPEKQTLRYRSQQKLYAIPPDGERAEGEFEGLYLSECHVPNPRADLPEHIGYYTLTIEAPIGTSGELDEASHKIGTLAQDLDKFWIYSCGEPLLPLVTGMSFDGTPKGWQSNMEDVKAYLVANCRQRFAVVQMNNLHWITMPYYPLRPALQARDKYQKADYVTQALADLHYSALKSPVGEGRLFSFAKALELARSILPGNDDARKEKSLNLPKGHLKRTFHWLFDVGNNRFNTRHVVRKGSATPALHARMTGQELVDYQHDADLILRTLVCQKLQVVSPNLRRASEHPTAIKPTVSPSDATKSTVH